MMSDPIFEQAVEAVISGDLATLDALLRDHPGLAQQQSDRKHKATLLHYVAANGVENERQRSPANSVEVAERLVRAGADPNAQANTYFGGSAQTPIYLLVSSVHPARAGVQADLVHVLCKAGAASNGVEDDGLPLKTAIEFGYPPAAEALVECGARVDKPVFAAALGRVDLLRSHLADESMEWIYVDSFKRRSEGRDAVLGRAFYHACLFHQPLTADVLLEAGATIGWQGPQGMTALHNAASQGDDRMLDFLITRGAPLEVKNDYGGTVVDSTVWFARNDPQPGVDYPAVVEKLLAAGADPKAVTPFPTGIEPIDSLLRPK